MRWINPCLFGFIIFVENIGIMKERIQELIAAGKTEEALELLRNCTDEAVLLMGRYTASKRQYNMGLIDFGEWQRVQNQVNYAALELAGNCREDAKRPAVVTDSRRISAFISYNQQDSNVMNLVKSHLEANRISVIVDVEDMRIAQGIQDFIDQALQENHFILSIISENSLLSGWVSKELNAAILLNRLSSRWIPVMIDKKWMEPEFFFDANKKIDEQLEEMKRYISKALEDNLDIRVFEDKRARLIDLKANLSPSLEILNGVLVTDISGEYFLRGMDRVVKRINSI